MAVSSLGSGPDPITQSTTTCNGSGSRSAIGVDSRLRKKMPAMCGQKGRASAMRRR